MGPRGCLPSEKCSSGLLSLCNLILRTTLLLLLLLLSLQYVEILPLPFCQFFLRIVPNLICDTIIIFLCFWSRYDTCTTSFQIDMGQEILGRTSGGTEHAQINNNNLNKPTQPKAAEHRAPYDRTQRQHLL